MKRFCEFVILKENVTPQDIEAIRSEISSLRPIGGMVNPQQWTAKLTQLSQQYPWLNSQAGPSSMLHGISLPQGSGIQKMIALLNDPQANFANFEPALEALRILYRGIEGQLSDMSAKLKPSKGGTPDYYKYQ